MGKARKASQARNKFVVMKKMVTVNDPRIRWKQDEKEALAKRGIVSKKDLPKKQEVQRLKPVTPHMFFKYNTALGPPYHILLDTNFINFSIQSKLDVVQSGMDCLYGNVYHVYQIV